MPKITWVFDTTLKYYQRNTCPTVDDITMKGTLLAFWETIVLPKFQVVSTTGSDLMRETTVERSFPWCKTPSRLAVQRRNLCFQVTSRLTPIRRSPSFHELVCAIDCARASLAAPGLPANLFLAPEGSIMNENTCSLHSQILLFFSPI